jgi:hypothetical protein
MVTGAFEAKFKSGEAVEAEERIEKLEESRVRTRKQWPSPRRRIKPLVALNWTLAALLLIDLVGELIVYGTAWTLIAAIPAGAVFGRAAIVQSRSLEPSPRWLRASGWLCVFLGGVCALSFYGSLMAPVDIACAVTSALFGVLFAGAAYYQLRMLDR